MFLLAYHTLRNMVFNNSWRTVSIMRTVGQINRKCLSKNCWQMVETVKNCQPQPMNSNLGRKT